MIPILSDEWNELWVKEAPAFQPGPGPSGSLEVSLRRDGESRTFTTYFTDGLLTAVGGADPDADLHVEIPESLWVSVCEGRPQEMERAMLKGEMRLTGERDRLMTLVPVLWSEEAQALRAHIHAQTIY